jgi:hypothetical protein
MANVKTVCVSIEGNGVAKHKGKRYSYRQGIPTEMPEQAAKATGKDYTVIKKEPVKNKQASKEK